MDVLILRLIHIGAGVFWVGAVYMFFTLIQPTAAALGPDSQRFMYHLIHERHVSLVILLSAAITVVAGLLLLWLGSDGFQLDLLVGTSRLGFTIGGVAAILAFAVGGLYAYPRTRAVERILGSAIAEGRPPSDEDRATLGRIGQESRTAGIVVMVALGVAVITMATARYWPVVL
jgi:uncharacterized membrane protein